MDTMITAFEVGGCVRDSLLGVATKDIDFAVEAPSFTAMRDWLTGQGFVIFVETPEFLTIRAHFPKSDPIYGHLTADFVLCRRDGRSSNSRHPDQVTAGTLADDLARRDFTVNAMAKHPVTGEIIDPHNGRTDLSTMTLRFVGDPAERLAEDSLRALRAVRFAITKGFTLADETRDALMVPTLPAMLASVSTERVRDELHKAFRADTIGSIRLLDSLGLLDYLFTRQGLSLEPTMRVRPAPRGGCNG